MDFLTFSERCELEAVHHQINDKKACDKIKAVLLLDKGWSSDMISEALLISGRSAKRYAKAYQKDGIEGITGCQYTGRTGYLDERQCDILCYWLDNNICPTSKHAKKFIFDTFKITYTCAGLVKLLKRLGYSHKKTKAVPAKANAEKQAEWIDSYVALRSEMDSNDKLYFVDGVHPTHNSVTGYAWVKKGEIREIKTNTGRDRLNINGAIDIDGLDFQRVYGKSINAQSTIRLFKKLEKANPFTKNIYVVRDNARYYSCRLVTKYLAKSRIKILKLPPYSPNLNLIERLWKLLREKVMQNQYYENVNAFKKACDDFFLKFKGIKFQKILRSRLEENFRIIGQT